MLRRMCEFMYIVLAGLITFVAVTGIFLLKALSIFAKLAFIYGSFYCGVSAFTLGTNLLMKSAGILSITNALKEITGIFHFSEKKMASLKILMSVSTLACGIFCIGSGCPVISLIIWDSSLDLLKGAQEYIASVRRGPSASRQPVFSDINSHRVLNGVNYNRGRDPIITNRADISRGRNNANRVSIPREWGNIPDGMNISR